MNKKIKTVVMFVVSLIGLSCAGCGVTPEEFEEAVRVCEPHGGLKEYCNPVVLNHHVVGDAICNNGLVIKEHRLKTKKLLTNN